MSNLADDGVVINATLKTARTPQEVFKNYDEVRRIGNIDQALVLVLTKTDDLQILTNTGTTQSGLRKILEASVRAVDDILRTMAKPVLGPDTRHQTKVPDPRLPTRPRKLSRNAQGMVTLPANHAFIECGDCKQSKFYVMTNTKNNIPVMLICSGCGNELSLQGPPPPPPPLPILFPE